MTDHATETTPMGESIAAEAYCSCARTDAAAGGATTRFWRRSEVRIAKVKYLRLERRKKKGWDRKKRL